MLREFILEVIVQICSLSAVAKCCCRAELKSILGVGPKVNDFIEDPFK